MDEDDTLKFLEDLEKETTNKKLRNLLHCLISSSPSLDLAYGDWNDREYFYAEEYGELVEDTARELENIMGVRRK